MLSTNLMRWDGEGGETMKKPMAIITSCVLVIGLLAGCTQAERASYNLSKEADNFNDIRRLTVINCLQGDVLFQMQGRMSIAADVEDNQLEIIVENGEDDYSKHFVGLSDNVTYVIEDVEGADVENTKYTLNFNPDMWIPANVKAID